MFVRVKKSNYRTIYENHSLGHKNKPEEVLIRLSSLNQVLNTTDQSGSHVSDIEVTNELYITIA